MNKTILITGGTGTVGSKLVEHFFYKKYNVIFTTKNDDEITKLIKKINIKNYNKPSPKLRLTNNKILGISIDLTKNKSYEIILKFIEKNNLYPNYLINCARSLSYLKVNIDGFTRRPEWLGEFTLDVIVPYELSIKLTDQKNSKLKSIINISSIYGIVPPNPSIYKNPKIESPIQYGVSKAAQIHLTKELAIRLSNKNIQVNSISFGGIKGRANKNFIKKYSKLCPLKRMLEQDEVIGSIDFLVSTNSSNITGHNLVVDGGWTVW
ncbi:SDR family oxidoreductase [Candidatus Babeliales bacterium]|nr:SDR family oxidoreductase [Candidatus Babeliales bacterium]